jgi:hypothetical protein
VRHTVGVFDFRESESMGAKTLLALAMAGVTLLFSACGGDGNPSDEGPFTGSEVGTLQVLLTDAPACGYDEVAVTVKQVRVHARADAEDGDGGWAELTPAAPVRVDLLRLTNGERLDLGRLTLPAGSYSQMRLVLASNDDVAPLENSVKPTGGVETALKTPSGQQSGLKIPLDVVVPEGQVARVVIDFDACRSIVKAGRSGQYLLKPVLKAIVLFDDEGQRVEGCVDAVPLLAATSISLQAAGVPVRATVPKADGCFVLFPVPEGRYDLVVTSPGRVTAVMTDVPVTLDEPTVVGTAGLRIPLPLSLANYAAAGSVSPVDAAVRVLQTLTDGPTVEVAWLPVDSADGTFGGVLPADAPIRSAYPSIDLLGVPGNLGFSADTAVAGDYAVEARKAGLATQVQDIEISGGPAPDLSFVLN